MKTHSSQDINELAQQVEKILREGTTQADALFVKTASISSQISRLKAELNDDISRRSEAGKSIR